MTMQRTVLLCFVCALAGARTLDGTLGVLKTPNDMRPAIVAAGATFIVQAQERGELRMTNDLAEFALSPIWEDLPGAGARASVAVPNEAPAGAYTLEWSKGDEADRNMRSVYVMAAQSGQDPYSQRYAFACIALPWNAPADPKSNGKAATLADAVNGAQVQFAVVFVRGPEDQFNGWLQDLHDCRVPTWAVAAVPLAVGQRWFGPETFALRYGADAYLVLGSSEIEDDAGAAPGQIAKLRLDQKTARWAVGLFSSPASALSMRNEITLFVDDPLHACIYGYVDAAKPLPKTVGWGGWFEPTRLFATANGKVVVFQVDRKGISLQKPVAAGGSK